MLLRKRTAINYMKSVIYQCDLKDLKNTFKILTLTSISVVAWRKTCTKIKQTIIPYYIIVITLTSFLFQSLSILESMDITRSKELWNSIFLIGSSYWWSLINRGLSDRKSYSKTCEEKNSIFKDHRSGETTTF